MKELVSIVIPVHNAGRYLEETIGSVLAQTYTDWELILVDDASADDSAEVMRSQALSDERIRVLSVTGEKHGAAVARNTGTAAAAGRYLAFLDADDVWKKDKLEKELNFMKEKDAAFVFTGYEFADDKARPTGHIVHVPETITYREALSNTTIFTSTVLFDLSKLDRSTVYMPEIESEDTATWWQVLRSIPAAYGLDENLVLYRRSSSSLSANKFKAIRRIWRLYRKAAGLSRAKSLALLPAWAFGATKRRLKKSKEE